MRICAVLVVGALLLSAAVSGATLPSHKFKTPGAPAFPIAYDGFLWVATHRLGAIYKIDPRSNRIVHTYQTDGSGAYLDAAQGQLAYYTEDVPGGQIVDVRTGRVRSFDGGRDFALPIAEGETLWGNVDYAGSEWTVGPNSTLIRLDPKTHVLLKRWPGIDFDGNPVTVADGALWIPGLTSVSRVDPRNDTLTIIPLPGALKDPGENQGYAVVERLAITSGAIWTTNPAGLYRIDLRTNTAKLVPGIRIGNLSEWGYIDLVAALGSLFLRNGDNQVVRLDPKTMKITARYPGGGGGGGIEVAYGSLWVTNFISDTTWRIPLR